MPSITKMTRDQVVEHLTKFKTHVPMEHIVKEVEQEVKVKGKKADKVVEKHIMQAKEELVSPVKKVVKPVEKVEKVKDKKPLTSTAPESQSMRAKWGMYRREGLSVADAWAKVKSSQ